MENNRQLSIFNISYGRSSVYASLISLKQKDDKTNVKKQNCSTFLSLNPDHTFSSQALTFSRILYLLALPLVTTIFWKQTGKMR